MNYEVKIEKFNGPLDLLLQLIEKQKLEITEISLAEVTEHYLAEVERLEHTDPEELSDFLVIAARLLLFKSKALLPVLAEEEDLDDLEKQLKMYKEFVDASKKIESMIAEKRFTFSREKLPAKTEVEFTPPKEVKPEGMCQVFLTVLKRLDPLVKIPRQAIAKTVSLREKILHLRDFITQQKKIGFNQLMDKAENKTEIIINFLAILELVKQKHLRVRQSSSFEDIMIEKI